jgi:hypothetical protein
MPTEALGSAKEAHRRWPEGRSEQGASKAKDGPSQIHEALPRVFIALNGLNVNKSQNFKLRSSVSGRFFNTRSVVPHDTPQPLPPRVPLVFRSTVFSL